MTTKLIGYVAPSLLLAASVATRKLTVGATLDPHEMGWAPHPMFGELPAIRVIAVTDDGRLLDGLFTCTEGECEEQVLVHSGDWFQKRRCAACQAKHNKGKRSKALDPETKEANKAEQAAKRAADAVRKAQEKLAAAQAKAAGNAQAIKDRQALIEATAASKGVEVSPATQAEFDASGHEEPAQEPQPEVQAG